MAEAFPPRPTISPVRRALLPVPLLPVTKFTFKHSQLFLSEIKAFYRSVTALHSSFNHKHEISFNGECSNSICLSVNVLSAYHTNSRFEWGLFCKQQCCWTAAAKHEVVRYALSTSMDKAITQWGQILLVHPSFSSITKNLGYFLHLHNYISTTYFVY